MPTCKLATLQSARMCAVLQPAGPSFAKEVMMGRPTGIVAASKVRTGQQPGAACAAFIG